MEIDVTPKAYRMLTEIPQRMGVPTLSDAIVGLCVNYLDPGDETELSLHFPIMADLDSIESQQQEEDH